MSDIKRSASIACPHPGCGGRMVVQAGSETTRMLVCSTCGEYYYRVGWVSCIGCHAPRNRKAADRLLEAPDGQQLRPDVVAKISEYRAMLGLPE